MLSTINHSIKDPTEDQTAIIPMTDEELAAVGGGFGWPALLVVCAYVAAVNAAWSLGEKIGDAL